jgi:hypothetical protein
MPLPTAVVPQTTTYPIRSQLEKHHPSTSIMILTRRWWACYKGVCFLLSFVSFRGCFWGGSRGLEGDDFSGSYQDLNPHHAAHPLSASKKQTETKRVEMQCFVNDCHVCVMYPAGSMVLPVPVSMIDQYHKPFEGEHVNRALDTHEGWLFKTTPDGRERLSQRAPDCTVRNIPLNAHESSIIQEDANRRALPLCWRPDAAPEKSCRDSSKFVLQDDMDGRERSP